MKSQYLESVDEGGTCHGEKRKRQREREKRLRGSYLFSFDMNLKFSPNLVKYKVSTVKQESK